ncbi:MAG TPA: acyl-CoA dehydrogenase family protein [Trebonia sp.]
MSPGPEEMGLFRDPVAPEPADVLKERMLVREFLGDAVASGLMVPQCDGWLSGHSPAFSAALGRRGWIGMTWPRQCGGREMPPAVRLAVIEELLVGGAPVAAHWFADRQIGPSLLRHGTAAQREFFLPRMARGELYFCVGMSEPDAGSDLGSVRTRAARADGGWTVSGAKIWTSHAQHAHHMLALVRTGGPAERKSKALTQMIIDMTRPGITVRPIRMLDGREHFCEVFLDDVFVPDDWILGQPGGGWSQVLGELGFERSGPERFLSTFPLLSGVVREAGTEAPGAPSADAETGGDAAVGALIARLVVLRAMSARVAGRLGGGEAPGVPAAIVKDLGTVFENDSLDVTREWLASHDADTGLAGLFEQAQTRAPGFTLRGGASEIMRDIVARAWGLS